MGMDRKQVPRRARTQFRPDEKEPEQQRRRHKPMIVGAVDINVDQSDGTANDAKKQNEARMNWKPKLGLTVRLDHRGVGWVSLKGAASIRLAWR